MFQIFSKNSAGGLTECLYKNAKRNKNESNVYSWSLIALSSFSFFKVQLQDPVGFSICVSVCVCAAWHS